MSDYRNYKNAPNRVKECYKRQRINQTYKFAKFCKEKYCKFENKDTFWNIFDKLVNFIDLSDPDINLSNDNHAYQTAESIRRDGHPDWMQLVGLIHDLGKIIYVKGCDEDGTSMETQWALVGDTYITGCKIPDTIVYPEFNKLNPDMNNSLLNTNNGLCKNNIGLDNVICSFGHDEYLYHLLKFNKVNLPKEAYYMIRYHSLYLWHTENEYSHLENNKDKDMKKWVKLFNKYDLYTKEDTVFNNNELREYYKKIVNKYLPNVIYF